MKYYVPNFIRGELSSAAIVINTSTEILILAKIPGETPPTITTFTEPSDTNAEDLLGASITREALDANWELRVNKEQDYENSLLGKLKRYSFDILADNQIFLVFLKINNIDDNMPYFRTLTNPCEIRVSFQRK